MGKASDFKARTRQLKRQLMDEIDPSRNETESGIEYPDYDSNDWGLTESQESLKAPAAEEESAIVELESGDMESAEDELDSVDLDDIDSDDEELEALEQLTASDEALLDDIRKDDEPVSELTWPDELTPINDKPKAVPQAASKQAEPAEAPATATEAVRRELSSKARDTTLMQLAKQGLKNVKVLGMNTVEKIVADAVANSLERFAVDQTVAQRQALEQDARKEFFKLLKRHKKSTQERSELAKQVVEMREELAKAQTALAHEQRGTAQLTPETIATLETTFRGLLDGFMDDERRKLVGEDHPHALRGLSELEKKLGAAFDRLLDRVKSKKEELLQLRIGKLNAALEETETALRALAQAKGFDDGIASVYDSIQGLDVGDLDYERKKDLLAIVFVENLQIQGCEITEDDRQVYSDALAALGTPPEARPSGLKLPEGFAAPVEVDTTDVAF